MREAYGSKIIDPSDVVAILLADIHLTLNPPIWRSTEPDWLEAQAKVLKEVKELQHKYECPVLCAGDIFNRWNTCPELINFAISHLPDSMYAIPGQHDLPLHQIEDIHRSAYWTLVKAGKIINVEKGKALKINEYKIKLYGFPYGAKLIECYDKLKDWTHIAIIHNYFWMENKKYTGAPRKQHIDVESHVFAIV